MMIEPDQLAALERIHATSYLIAWDLAQGGADFNAMSVLERTQRPYPLPATYDVVWLERFRDWRTARIPERTVEAVGRLRDRHRRRIFDTVRLDDPRAPLVRVVVDQTGVGPFALDPMRERGLDPIGITITGGDAVSSPRAGIYRVPKRDLASAVYNLLEGGRLRVADLPESRILRAELQNFRVKIKPSGHDTYGAGAGAEWREGEHDDMVLSVACAAWVGEALGEARLDPAMVAAWSDLPMEHRANG